MMIIKISFLLKTKKKSGENISYHIIKYRFLIRWMTKSKTYE